MAPTRRNGVSNTLKPSNGTNIIGVLPRIAERHPGLRLTIDHLGGRGGLTTLKDAAAMTYMPALLALGKFPNVAVKATGAPGYSSETYPFPKMHTYLRQIYDEYSGPAACSGGRNTEDAVLLGPVRDDVHRGIVVAQRPGQETYHGGGTLRLVGVGTGHPDMRRDVDKEGSAFK